MSNLRYIISFLFVLSLSQSASAEFVELDNNNNEFNQLIAPQNIPSGSTPNQFKSAIFFSSTTHGVKSSLKTEPMVTGVYTLRHTRVGGTFYSQTFEYKFGSVIYPPITDKDGNDMAPEVSPSDYWRAKPHNAYKTKLQHFNKLNQLTEEKAYYGRFHWSDSSQKVYATRPGPVNIVWVKKEPEKTTPSLSVGGWSTEEVYNNNIPPNILFKLHTKSNSNGVVTEMFREENGSFYSAVTERVIISGSPAKTPRKIFWTGTKYSGVPVIVPEQRITDVKIVYTEDFPKTVHPALGELVQDNGITLQEGEGSVAVQTRTLWYDKVEKSLKALNKQGRVFVELLGTNKPGENIPQSLDHEIVDVIKQPNLQRERVELGDPFPILEPLDNKDELKEAGINLNLFPQFSSSSGGRNYVYQHFGANSDRRSTFYAVKETINDTELILWWLIEGKQGIKWPERYVRYDLDWPAAPDKYSHYLRPAVDNEEEAKKTAVKLPSSNAPMVAYQDDSGFPRAKIIQGDFKFYTYLTSDYPAHRTLLRYTSGDYVDFERVFSWLDSDIKDKSFPKNRVTDSLGEYDPKTDSLAKHYFITDPINSKIGEIDFPASLVLHTPKTLAKTIYVGESLTTPENELGSKDEEGYLAAFVNAGTSYDPDSYINPFSDGFEEANKGAVIPVNAIPGKNVLEVMWFRKNTKGWIKTNENEAQQLREEQGFKNVYWPTVLATYTIKWPHEIPNYQDVSKDTAIVLASNDGSGPLNSLQAKGSVYFQNDVNLTGYNPNEEHAMLHGGQLYALRNDLNLTPKDANGDDLVVTDISDETYSSEPYVLLKYTGEDDRPAMRAFRVLKELGEDKFNYTVSAGTILQPPMPIPLMQKLKDNDEFNGDSILDYSLIDNGKKLKIHLSNKTAFKKNDIINLSGFAEAGNNGWAFVENLNAASDKKVLEVVSMSNPITPKLKSIKFKNNLLSGKKFTEAKDRNYDTNAYYKADVEAGKKYYYEKYSEYEGLWNDNRFIQESGIFTAVNNYVHIRRGTRYNVRSTVDAKLVKMLEGDDDELFNYIVTTENNHGLTGDICIYNAGDFSGLYSGEDYGDKTISIKSQLNKEILKFEDGGVFERSSTSAFDKDTNATGYSPNARYEEPTQSGNYSKVTMADRENNIWVYRGPHKAPNPEGDGTIDVSDKAIFSLSFYYKTLEGFWFPSLKSDQLEVGTPVPYLLHDKNQNLVKADNEPRDALKIKYKAVWPSNSGVLRPGQTLTYPVFGLPAIRGNTSLKILYQQSKAIDANNYSATLHDPTREKVYDLEKGTAGLFGLPSSAATYNYKGKIYFTHLPPHLVDRFFFDPNRGNKGQLVLRGEFVDEVVGEDYLLMNVLSGDDLKSIKRVADLNMGNTKWNEAINKLTAKVETFKESAVKAGVYISDVSQEVKKTASQLVEIVSDETAVDSYALSADGNKSGYVTLIAGNGQAFTPKEEPVQMHVIKVDGPLYKGEAKVLLSDNPLSEKVTLMHTGDLAGSTNNFEYEWRTASADGGAPPDVFERVLINGTTANIQTEGWKHLRQVPTTGTLPADGDSLWDDHNLEMVTVQESNEVSDIAFRSDINTRMIDITTAQMHNFKAGDVVNLVGFIPESVNVNGLTVQSVAANTVTLTKDSVANLGGLTIQENGIVEESFSGVSASSSASMLTGKFKIPSNKLATDVYLSMTADSNLGVRVKVGSAVVAVKNVSATVVGGTADTEVSSAPELFQPLPLVYRIDTSLLRGKGEFNKITVELWSNAEPGSSLSFNLKLEANELHDKVKEPEWKLREQVANDLRSIVIGETADVAALSDNYLMMRYRSTDAKHMTRGVNSNGETIEGWSHWTKPQLSEGWIKRVVDGINPFNQRVGDLYSKPVRMTGSMLTQAGKRWEGDVALNMDNINEFGLIEIYETVLNRGRMLSIDAGINVGAANDALLLAAGYLNDLYMILGNEAWADAANPTIGIGTNDKTYGDIATSLFAFKGQVPSLLEEELALLRGRDDFQGDPGVEAAPVYNRMYWNYTKGIDSGEVIYSLNYNIQDNIEGSIKENKGKIDAEDAYKMFPQGHGDGYGHYLTALKGYYRLLVDNDFTWVPSAESVLILGKAVQVDYTDERKFAAAAAAIARTGNQIVDLTWRKDYNADKKINWDKEFSPTRDNTKRAQSTKRHWGMDHWASRSGQGALINWVVGNSILPELDLDPEHEGIQKIDRSTVPELSELSAIVNALQLTMDSAEAGMNPLGLNEDTVAMDISPDEGSHFEQILERAENALNNATIAFDSTKDMTQLMRSEQDSLFEREVAVEEQELAYKFELIELYGTPYPDDIGPGKTYKQGWDGPDLYHYSYVDELKLTKSIPGVFIPKKTHTFKIDLQTNPINMSNYGKIGEYIDSSVGFSALKNLWKGNVLNEGFKFMGDGEDNVMFSMVAKNLTWENENYHTSDYVEYTLEPSGFPIKPSDWGTRSTLGEIQQAITAIRSGRNKLGEMLATHEKIKYELDREIELFESQSSHKDIDSALDGIKVAIDLILLYKSKAQKTLISGKELSLQLAEDGAAAADKSTPENAIAGTAAGGSVGAPAKGAIKTAELSAKAAIISGAASAQSILGNFEIASLVQRAAIDTMKSMEGREVWVKESVLQLDLKLKELNVSLYGIADASLSYGGSKAHYRNLLAKGLRIQEEREMFRQNTARTVQNFRTRDAAFRVFRNEKLERYKALQDMASMYTFLAAQAYDYETGLLGTDEGRKFINRIVNSRALGVVVDGEPQFAGSNTGDPGISSVLAEMKNDWSVIKGRLGFNNPDQYATSLSLRNEKYRILPGQRGALQWGDVLEGARKQNIMNDGDVRRYCMQVGFEDDRPVPGLIIEFSTTIKKGENVFGLPLAGGDNQFSSSNFATKIWSAGIAFEGYVGMSEQNTNDQGGLSPSNPTPIWLDPTALSKNPYVYLIPVGKDFMRSPPLGDTSKVRSWTINDVAIPLPFNIGNSEHSSKKLWQSSASLTEELFAIRKYQPFRALDSFDTVTPNTSIWKTDGYDGSATSRRLIGRSVWNSKWKLVIPGYTLLNDPEEGLDRFIQTVEDIKVHFNTYSYSGN